MGGGEGGAPGPQPPCRPGRRGHGGWGARRGRGGHAVGLRAEGGPGGCSGSTPARWGHRARSCPPALHPFNPASCSCPVSQRSWSLALGGQNIRFRSSSSGPPPPASVSLSLKRVGGSWSLPRGICADSLWRAAKYLAPGQEVVGVRGGFLSILCTCGRGLDLKLGAWVFSPVENWKLKSPPQPRVCALHTPVMDLRKVQGGQRDFATPGFLGSPVPRDWLGKTFC